MRLTRVGVVIAVALAVGVIMTFLQVAAVQIAGFCIVIVALVLFAGDWMRTGESHLMRGTGSRNGAGPDAYDDQPL